MHEPKYGVHTYTQRSNGKTLNQGVATISIESMLIMSKLDNSSGDFESP